MRRRVVVFLLFLLGGLATLSLTRGQEHPATPAAAPSTPAATPTSAAVGSASAKTTVEPPVRKLPRLSPLQQQLLLSAQRGGEWLYRMNGTKGRFVPGYLPALGQVMEEDSYLRQAGAALALAQMARFTGEERYSARATQAILTLLDETVVDGDPPGRHTALPALVLDRLASAGLLIAAINELPAPQPDLLERSEELCAFLRRQVQPDGSLRNSEGANSDPKAGPGADPSAESASLALYALMISQKHRPASWKTDLVRKALPYYRHYTKEHRSVGLVAWQTAACAEAYVKTKEGAFAEHVFEMNDWLCGLQITQIPTDPRRYTWYGGFLAESTDPVEAPPRIDSACCAASLAHAWRVAREATDVSRHQRYNEALERGLQFVATLQFTADRTQHFVPEYRPWVIGAFHASCREGDLRLDYTQQAVSALVQYLECLTP